LRIGGVASLAALRIGRRRFARRESTIELPMTRVTPNPQESAITRVMINPQ
jgi:hypothetical protein